MDCETRQFVKPKTLQKVERKSSLYMKVADFEKFALNKKIDSEKIKFLDGDDVWWISLQKKIHDLGRINIKCYIETSDYIWQSGIWSCSISGNVNETKILQENKYKVHKNILASASPVFDKLFTSKFRENETNECCVTAIEPTIFQYLLNFIYCGELPESLNEVSRALYEAAHYYQINELADICLSVVCYHSSKDNAVAVYEWADKMNLENVKKNAWSIIQFEILHIFEEIPPPPFQSVEPMIKKKIENDELLKQYQLKVSELKNVTKDLFK